MSVPYTVHDAAGRILRSGTAPDEAQARLQGEHVLIGEKGDDARQQVVGGVLVDLAPVEPTLDEAKAELRDEADRRAAARRRALMPPDDVLLLMAEAIADPAGPAAAELSQWRADAAAIEADRMRARQAIENATTVADAHAAAQVDWAALAA